jgi:hypothetical protein
MKFAPLSLALAAAAIAAPVWADGAKKKSPIDFSVGNLGDLPKADGMRNESSDAPKLEEPTATPTKATYALAKVVNAQQIVPRGDSYEARQTITKIEVSNLPMVLSGFHTWVRVRSPEKVGAVISVKLLDPNGRTIADSDGDLVFGSKTETDFLVDWTSLQLNHSGIYKVQVDVAGDKVGETPLPVTQLLRATLSETAVDAGS